MGFSKFTYSSFFICILFLSNIHSQNRYNLDFEDFDSVSAKLPKGWFKWGNIESVSSERLNNGNALGKVEGERKKFGCITYRIPANYIGDTIELKGWVKYKDVKEFVGLLMRLDGFKKYESLGFESMQKLGIKGTRDWKEYSIKLPFPTNTRFIFIGGILGGEGTAWFDNFQVLIDGKDIQTLDETKKILLKEYDSLKLRSAIANASRPFNVNGGNLDKDLNSLVNSIGDKKIVAIGESTHGSSEFYRLREALTKKLIKEKGFKMVVLESAYDDIEILNQQLKTNELDKLMKEHLFSIYQTEEMKSFLEWYKENKSKYNVAFKGCDDSYWAADDLFDISLNTRKSLELETIIEELKLLLNKKVSRNFKKDQKRGREIYDKVVQLENYLISKNQLDNYTAEVIFNLKNTYINYINIQKNESRKSRDEVMADRIAFLQQKSDEKIVVWAHNAHISNKIITGNEIGIMGRNLKKEFGEDYCSVGLTTLNGTYSYIDEKFINGDHDYGEELKTEKLNSLDGSFWEDYFSQYEESFYLDTKELATGLETNQVIGSTRFIGYAKETEDDIYHIPILENFDKLLFIKTTNATTPLPHN